MSGAFEAEVLPQPEAISALTEQVMAYLSAEGVDARAAYHVGLVFEELLSNLGSHGRSPDKSAQVRVIIESGKVRAQILDKGPAFDIRAAAEPVFAQSIEEREIGGLGLFLVRQLASEIAYERHQGMNCTRFSILRSPAQ